MVSREAGMLHLRGMRYNEQEGGLAVNNYNFRMPPHLPRSFHGFLMQPKGCPRWHRID